MSSRTDDVTTSSPCSGNWKSKVAGKDDKEFHHLKVDSSGNITGKHDGKEIISGRCDKQGNRHRITLKREDDKNVYEYSGLITDEGTDNFSILPGDGKRTPTPKAKPLEEKSRDDKTKDKDKFTDPEEWVAEKTGT